MDKTSIMFQGLSSIVTQFSEKIQTVSSSLQNQSEHISIMSKDGKDKVSYLQNLEYVSKIKQRLYSPVKSLKKKLTTLQSLMSKEDLTKGI